MYEKYLEQLEEAGKIRNLKERSINCYKNYVSDRKSTRLNSSHTS